MSALPAALLELTFLRAAARFRFLSVSPCCRRSVHSYALVDSSPLRQPPRLLVDQRFMPSERSGPLSELEQRVHALEEASQRENMVFESPSYSEEELVAFYEELLDISPEHQEQSLLTDTIDARESLANQDLSIISAVEQRLLGSFPPVNDVEQELGPNLSKEASANKFQPYQRLLSHLDNIMARLETVQKPIIPMFPETPKSGNSPQQSFLANVISVKECEALVRVTLQVRDRFAAEKALDIMKQTCIPLSSDATMGILRLYADEGDVPGFEQAMTRYLTETPTEEQRHLHIKAHLNATVPDAIPTSALQVIHNYELQSHPVSMKTYTLVIGSLFSRPSSLARAQAWDLFSHMRYVAHPQPDVLLYTMMIRACASPISSTRTSEPERALDLWTEMTVDNRIAPTSGAYNAVILACAKSGLRRYVKEAFRLAKEMLDSNRDAEGNTSFRPDRRTFCALLEGAKRVGDLARARWILAEMTRVSKPGARASNGEADTTVNEEVMMHVFHAYAAYNPPFVRSIAPASRDHAEAPNDQSSHQEGEADTSQDSKTRSLVIEDPYPSFTQIPPQSRQEVIYEASVLFRRILADTRPQPIDETSHIEQKFQDVALTTRLLNSYMSVFYRHSSFEIVRDMFWKIYDDLDVKRSARTYVEALERCAHAKKGRERQIASQFTEELWSKWEEMENSKHDGDQPLSPRLIERAHIARMRTLAVNEDTDRAVSRLRGFVSRYPPHAIRQTTSIPELRSTRTSLVGARPLVRMESKTSIPDDHVPPFLTFSDVEVLHHRLIASQSKSAWEQIGYIKWVCKAYEWALRVRRQEMNRLQNTRSL